MLPKNSINWAVTAARDLRRLSPSAQFLIIDAVDHLVAMPNCKDVSSVPDRQFAYQLAVEGHGVMFEWFSEVIITDVIKLP